MQRLVFAALLGLSLAVGLTLGTVAWRTATFDRTMPDLGAADPTVGYAFYAAIDRVLAGDDADALHQVVTGDFTDHAGDDADSLSTDELVAQLAAYGTSFPGTQIQVTDIQASASSLVAAIAPISPKPVSVAGLMLTAQPSNGGYEVLRIRNGKVSERWTAGLPELTATSFDEAAFSASTSANIAIQLDRITLPKGTSMNTQMNGSGLLVVEEGSVRIDESVLDSSQNLSKSTSIVAAGSAVGFRPGAQIQLESDSNNPASLLLYTARRVVPTDLPPPTFTGGATSDLLWSSNLPLAASGSWQFSLGKIELPADGAATLQAPEGTTLLLCSDGGPLQALAQGGTIKTLDVSFTAAPEGNATTIDAGVAANVSDAAQISLRSGGDAIETIWLIAIVPDVLAATPVS